MNPSRMVQIIPILNRAAIQTRMIAMTKAAITAMTNQGAETINENLRRQSDLRNFFNLTCKMSENRLQLASTFVLFKTLLFQGLIKERDL